MSDTSEVISTIIERMKNDATLAVVCRDSRLEEEFREALSNMTPRLMDSCVLHVLRWGEAVRIVQSSYDDSYAIRHATASWYEAQPDRTLIWLDDLVEIRQDFTSPPDLSILLGGAL